MGGLALHTARKAMGLIEAGCSVSNTVSGRANRRTADAVDDHRRGQTHCPETNQGQRQPVGGSPHKKRQRESYVQDRQEGAQAPIILYHHRQAQAPERIRKNEERIEGRKRTRRYAKSRWAEKSQDTEHQNAIPSLLMLAPGPGPGCSQSTHVTSLAL